MSLEELKEVAIEKIKATNDEKKIQEVLRTLETGNNVQAEVKEFFERMVAQHGPVLKRLAE